jgi:hypothetical protein
MCRLLVAVIAVLMLSGAREAFSQEPDPQAAAQVTKTSETTLAEIGVPPLAESAGSVGITTASDDQIPGIKLPNSDRFRLSISFLAGYGRDGGNVDKGFERQGRIGYFILSMAGRLNSRTMYLVSLNPVHEISPLPACSEPNFLRPNDPQFLYADLYAAGRGPQIGCNPQGAQRTDLYRFVALDTMPQQGMLREAYVKFNLSTRMNAFMQLGRVAQPVGFNTEEAGSWTAKDAPLIQRLNQEAYFTLRMGLQKKFHGFQIGGSASAIVGDSDAGKDYLYKLFTDGSLDGNSGFGGIGEAFVRVKNMDFRVSYRVNETGSKLESFSPSYWASGKHTDNAAVFSAKYTFSERSMAVAECAHYTVGLKESSAVMVGSNPAPVYKDGCYATVQAGFEIRRGLAVGASFTHERIDRADSLIRYLSEKGLYSVVEGEEDRMSVARIFVEVNRQLRIGYYVNHIHNPFPWVSGIYPLTEISRFQGKPFNRTGLVVSFTLQ